MKGGNWEFDRQLMLWMVLVLRHSLVSSCSDCSHTVGCVICASILLGERLGTSSIHGLIEHDVCLGLGQNPNHDPSYIKCMMCAWEWNSGPKTVVWTIMILHGVWVWYATSRAGREMRVVCATSWVGKNTTTVCCLLGWRKHQDSLPPLGLAKIQLYAASWAGREIV